MNRFIICEGTGRKVRMANTETSVVLNSDIGIVSRGQQLQVKQDLFRNLTVVDRWAQFLGYAYPEDPRLSDGVKPFLLCHIGRTVSNDSVKIPSTCL
jgi:hypothetical protein